jgi:hypothetical protein
MIDNIWVRIEVVHFHALHLDSGNYRVQQAYGLTNCHFANPLATWKLKGGGCYMNERIKKLNNVCQKREDKST